MIFHQNHLPQLNGNKYIALLIISLIFGSCNLFQQARKPVDSDKSPVIIADEKTGQKDTAVTIADSIVMPVDDKKEDAGKWSKKDKYNIAFILPFSIDAEELYYLMDNEKVTTFQPLAAISFFEGALQALDTLRNMHLVNLDVYTFNAAKDSAAILSLISSGQLDKMDLIIGPVFTECLIPAARFAKEKEIFLISPLSPSPSITNDNPFYVIVSPTMNMQLKTVANYIAARRKPMQTIIIYQSDNALEQKLASDFKQLLSLDPKTDTNTIRMVTDINNLQEVIEAGIPNFIFIASVNELFVNQIFRNLSLESRNDNIMVAGLSSVLNFESLSMDYLESLHFHYPEGFWVDPLAPRVQRFKNDYVAKYDAAPDDYAARGFDITLYSGYLLGQYGPKISDGFNQSKPSQYLLSPIQFNPVINKSNAINYYENKGVTLMRYNNYRFEQAKD